MVINDGYVKQQKESDAKIELKNVGAKKMWYQVIEPTEMREIIESSMKQYDNIRPEEWGCSLSAISVPRIKSVMDATYS